MNRWDLLLVPLVLTSIAGCAGVSVSKDADTTPLKGIPFRIKVPVWVQETRIAETGWMVHFEIDDGNPKTTPVTVPAGGDVFVPCATINGIQAQAQAIQAKAVGAADIAGAADIVKQQMPSMTAMAPDPACRIVASNALKQESRISSSEYYITHMIPLFGSGSGEYEFNADGTLTKASSTVTDDTAKTLLALFPIREKLLQRWKAEPAAALVKGAKPPPPFTVDAVLTPRVTVYTLRKDFGTAGGASPVIGKPLDLAAARDGDGGIELVSTERSGGDDKGDDAAAWKIQGTIAPPAPAK
jgi:hypothetical protein